ncbi:MAG: CBS domain-containing protein, partial [Ignavibacteria bacterium]|nr:CBS domain-containing protein [Ignavibacteria bacterium]
LTTVNSYLSQEEIKQNLGDNSNKIKCLQLIKTQFDEFYHTSFAIEISFYIIAFTIANIYFLDQALIFTVILAINCISLFALFVLRSGLYSFSKKYANTVSLKICPLLVLLSLVVKPLSYIQKKIDSQIYGRSQEESLQELSEMVDNAMEEGSIEAGEYRILKNIMKFSDVLVSDVMTPRTVVFSLEADKTVGEIVNLPELQMYSRFPIWKGESLDDAVIGYVLSKDVMRFAISGKKDKRLREISREINFIHENLGLDKVLEDFLQKRQHLFLVVDEYGGVEGIITMEDVLETILGVEIVDEQDRFVDLRDVAKQMRDERVSNIAQITN